MIPSLKVSFLNQVKFILAKKIHRKLEKVKRIMILLNRNKKKWAIRL